MKLSVVTPHSHLALRSLALAFTLVPASYAADITWADSAGNTTWTTDNTINSAPSSASWVGGTAPVNNTTTDTALFTSVSNAQPTVTLQTRIAGIDFQMPSGDLMMNGGDGVGQLLQIGAGGIDATGQTSGTNTITNTRILTSGAANTWNIFSSVNTNSTSTFTFDSVVELGQNLTIIGQRDAAAGNIGIINFERAITASPTVRTLTINSSNTNNTVNLKGLNTYLGVTNVNGGIVNVQNDQRSATGGWNIQTPNTVGKAATVNFATGSQIEVDGTGTAKIQIGSTANSGSHPASTLNVAGTVTNNGNLQMERSSFLNLNDGAQWTQEDATKTMTLTARGGGGATVNVNAGAQMTYKGSSTVKLNSGTSGSALLTINGTGILTTGSGFENTNALSTGSGVSRVTLTNGGTLRLSADVTDLTTQTLFTLGTGGGLIDTSGFNATLSGAVTAGSTTTATGLTGTGNLTKIGDGTLTLSGANTHTGLTIVTAGTLAVLNDQSSATGGWSVGTLSANASTANFSAGSLIVVASGKQIRIGNTGASGSATSLLTVAGTVNNGGNLLVGRAASLVLDNGSIWTQSGDASLTSLGGTSAALTLNSGSALIYTGANTFKLNLNNSSSRDASLTVDGTAVFTTSTGFENAAAGITTVPTGNSSITLSNGGTLKLSASVPNLTTQVQFRLGTGGGVIDNSGFDVTLSGVVTGGTTQTTEGITGLGGLTSTGNGTLTLSGANTYTGDTTVTAGTLAVDSANFADTSTISVSSGATLALNFSGTDTVAALFINGVQRDAGLYDSSNSSGAITGTGSLTVTNDPGATDTTPPLISAASPVEVSWGSSYTDVPPTATDDIDPSVTVISSGTVNTAKPGTYTLTYNATDAANNAAIPVTRTVTVSIANPTTVGADGLSPLLRYALGANSPTDTVQGPVLNSTPTTLSLTAVVRTDDTALTVGAEAVDDLTGTWGTGGTITETDALDQSGVPVGSTRKVFTVETTGAARKFLRLAATLAP